MKNISRSAILSDCGRYRYRLYRSWDDGPFVVFLMFNPSTADAQQDDPTIRKCMGFAKQWGYPGITVVNLFAMRSSDPREISKVPFNSAVGAENDEAILTACCTASELVCAWGCGQHMRKRLDRADSVLRMIRRTFPMLPITCLGRGADGQPRHPLMLAYSTPRVAI
jgi:hypothetical protein